MHARPQRSAHRQRPLTFGLSRPIPRRQRSRMSGFAKINLLDDIEAGSRSPEVEARFGRSHLESRDLGISHFRYAPNFRNPMGHSHQEQEEAYIVAAGSGQILLDGEVHELRQWDVV